MTVLLDHSISVSQRNAMTVLSIDEIGFCVSKDEAQSIAVFRLDPKKGKLLKARVFE